MTVMEERFELASQRILEIEKEKRMPEQFQRYFAENADYLGVLLEEYKWIASGAMREVSDITFALFTSAAEAGREP